MSNVNVKAVSHKHTWPQALQLTPENIEEMEAFVNGSVKGTKLAPKDREVAFWAVKFPNNFIHVVTADTFQVLYSLDSYPPIKG